MDIADGEFIVFVGPSGCGKSTTLRMIAGLEDISAGELYIDGKLVNEVEPKDRDIAMVFQSYALYPHMTTYENIAFALKMRKIPDEVPADTVGIKGFINKAADFLHIQRKDKGETKKVKIMRHMTKAEIDEKVKWAAKVLGIEELLQRKPAEMSGGQRQRIALGRAMVRGPKVFLLDEPLSNLDAKLRTTMRSEIVKLHNELKTTFIYVTHDQVEAMTMGSRIVVMKLGVVQQIDTPTNLFDYPENKFVAGFIGTPQMNFFDVKIRREKDSLVTTFEDGQVQTFDLSKMKTIQKEYLDGQERAVTLGIRGENILLGEEGLSASVSFTEILGSMTHLFVKLGQGSDYIVCLSGRATAQTGDNVRLRFEEKQIHLFDKESECSLVGRSMGQISEEK
jgi:multiple sugar transport system ATP-binding protein